MAESFTLKNGNQFKWLSSRANKSSLDICGIIHALNSKIYAAAFIRCYVTNNSKFKIEYYSYDDISFKEVFGFERPNNSFVSDELELYDTLQNIFKKYSEFRLSTGNINALSKRKLLYNTFRDASFHEKEKLEKHYNSNLSLNRYHTSELGTSHFGTVFQKFRRETGLIFNESKLEIIQKLHNANPQEKEPLKEKKEEKMTQPTTSTFLSPTETVNVLSEAVKHGSQVAVADEAANAVLAVVEVLVSDEYPDLLKTEGGKTLAKLVAATLLHHLASSNVPFVPDCSATKAACGLVMEAAARDILQPKIKALTPVLANLATVGKNLVTT